MSEIMSLRHKRIVDDYENLTVVMAKVGFCKIRAAEAMGVNRKTIYNIIQRFEKLQTIITPERK